MCVGDEPTTQSGEDASVAVDSGGGTDTSTGADTAPSISDCEKRRADEATGVFVSINGADSETCGTRLQPCQLVNTAIKRAALLKKPNVFIARGTYTEAIQLLAGITLDGGWDPVNSDWKPVCGTDSLSATRFALAAAESRVVSADFTGDATLRQLTIESKRAAKPGESVYGVFATKAKLVLQSVVVTMGAGGDGSAGTKGNVGAVGDVRCAAGNATPGVVGPRGDVPVAGSFGETGYVASNGASGKAATAGANGPCATNSNCTTTCTAGAPASVCTAGCNKPLSGCGGKPGTPGEGGMGGGSSIAVYGWSATIVLKGGAFTAGNGGKGGAGGEGGEGGAGGPTTAEQLLCVTCSGTGCATVGNQTLATGALGGKGGNGGPGSGGAGGSSHAVYVGGPDAVFTTEQNPTLTAGQAGPGSDGSPAGAAAAVVAPR
jgi:hypothetical protein